MSRVGTRYHLAVVGGPDVGWVAPLPEDTEVVVGRGDDADLALADPRLSRRHLRVRHRRGRLVAHVRRGSDATARPGRRTRSGRTRLGRSRRLRSRGLTLTPGSRLTLGSSVIEVRDHPALAPEPRSVELSEGLGMRLLVPLAMSATMLPLALSTNSGSPWRTVTWLILPLVLVVSALWPWLRERARKRQADPRHAPSDDVPPPPPDPSALLVVADRPGSGPPPEWDVGTEQHHGRRRSRTIAPPPPGRGVALVGAPEACRAMARWLVCQAVHHAAPDDLRLDVPPSWDWTAPLPHTGPHPDATATLRVIETRPGAHPAPARDAVGILVATSLAEVPTWCTAVIEVDPQHDRRVSVAWAHEVATAIAQAAAGTGGLPSLVPLQDLLRCPSPEQVLRRWQRRPPGLTAPLGMGPEGPLWLDLAEAGPHALVAGTTGSGKSELLTTWVLGLTVAYAPRDVQVLLIDYKGGATFGALAELPHVVDVLTDLDAGTTARALASLRAELARRERVLSDAGVRSLRELPGGMPRLLVIVDEFRTLADAHPDLLDSLVRLAAQGRSLGIHLVLATQRPGGAVTADMRANISVRVCLRVLEQTDSHDVLGEDSAARLPAVPGRAVVRTDGSTTVQIAWPGSLDDGVARLLATLRTARDLAAQTDPTLVRVRAPWAPPLPASISTAELPEVRDDAVPFLLLDLPEEQRLGAAHLDLGDTLLISGPPRSGRTAAARTLAVEAVRRGITTHVVASEPLLPPEAPTRGTTCATDDVRRVQLLLQALERPHPARELLVIDDVEAMCRALDSVLPFGTALETMIDLLRAARRRRLGVVLTASPPAARWAAATHAHLVLAPRDLSDALVAGVPRELIQLGAPAGRGVLLDGATALVGHVALAPLTGPWPRPARTPLRIEPLPDLVALPPGLGAVPTGERVLLGLGGPDNGPVHAPLRAGDTLLVLGAPRTGRTTTLRMLAARLRAAGWQVWTDPAAVTPRTPGVLLLDDVDRLSAAAAGVAADAAGSATLIATARPEPLGASFHELARRLREPDAVLVLGQTAGTTAWTGIDVRPLVDAHQHPGRGVLVAQGRAVALQVDRGAPQSTVPEEDPEERLVAATDAGSSSPTPTTIDATIIG
ncbi:FtsK/SpoIIIE domain-containing protein [Pseudactinotalea terrae]|uniref:FtsK/SpoIIIE domain-containing protein n=1 Tax=Pseudactinotalea terrae TaxID=1743262 RepID=UPI0012E22682|nr:FtsK/SpoIIIE domain-containing protein [Pseudactinotalea terrae]